MRELIRSYEVWAPSDEPEETLTFNHTVTMWKDGENYYQISHSARVGKFDPDSLPLPTTPIPLVLFKGLWHSSLTECPCPPPLDSYQKIPAIILPDGYEEGTFDIRKTPGEHMLIEAKLYEILKQHPHPNICHYYGCIRDGQYLTAICLRKYKHTLHHAVQSGAALDRNVILSGIAKGLHFLHNTLGLVHNDINPSNIMLNDEGHPVIIDFDSCAQIGQDLNGRKRSTFGWERKPEGPEPNTSTTASDEYALSLIAQYLDVDNEGLPLPPDMSFLI
jgi:serine/threonine protein kinase